MTPWVKKIMLLFITTILAYSLFSKPAFAHPGRTAADGCHYCRTNCDYWGVPWNARHCHGGVITIPEYSIPKIELSPTPTKKLLPSSTPTPKPTFTPTSTVTSTMTPTEVVTLIPSPAVDHTLIPKVKSPAQKNQVVENSSINVFEYFKFFLKKILQLFTLS